MENEYRLAITPNYVKTIWKYVLLVICAIIPVILFGISLEKELINVSSIKLELVVPLYLIAVVATTVLVSRKTFFTDTVTLSDYSIEIPKMKNLNFDEITNYKTITILGFSTYFTTSQKGEKIAISPANNFSRTSDKIFRQFVSEFERKADNK
jgi:hypothetical protein